MTSLADNCVNIIGREKELQELDEYFKNTNRVLLVKGLGGIGKTELCKAYLNKNFSNYDRVGWINYIGNIKESLVNQISSKLLSFNKDNNLDERYNSVINFLENLSQNSLLIIDNIDNENDEDLKQIRKLPFKVLASSRCKFDGFSQYDLGFLSINNCKRLFYDHYTGEIDDNYLEKIIILAGKHTLTVELLAKTAESETLEIKELYEMLEKTGFNINDQIGTKVSTFWRDENDKQLFFEHLLKVFNLTYITDEDKYILMNLSILPSINIKIKDVKELLQLHSNDSINSLIKKGWINKNGHSILIHPLIQETIRYELKPSTEKCKILIISTIENLKLKITENPLYKAKYTILAESILMYLNEDNIDIATLSNNLASIYKALGKLEKAFEFQLKAVAISEKVFEENHPSLATSYHNLSLIYKALGKLEKALELQLKAVAISEKVLDQNHPDLATSYHSLASIYQALGKLEKALEFQLKAVAIREKVFEENHPDLATSYNNLASIYKALGKLEKAFEFQLKAVAIMEKVFEENHPDLATSYHNLASIYQAFGKLEKALEFQLKDVAIIEKVFEENHPSLATSYHNLSLIYKALGKLEKALELQLKAVAISEKVLDQNHPDLATSYHSLASIYQALGKLEQALEFQLKAVEIHDKPMN